MALWQLATGSDYRSIGQLFGVDSSTCCKNTHHVCDALVTVFLSKCVAIVANERLQETKDAFRIMSGLPQWMQLMAAIYQYQYWHRRKITVTTLIEKISIPIILQAVVDHKRRYATPTYFSVIFNICGEHCINIH